MVVAKDVWRCSCGCRCDPNVKDDGAFEYIETGWDEEP